ILSLTNLAYVEQWLPQPAAQQPRSHRRPRRVDCLDQRAAAAAVADRGEQLEVAPRVRVDNEETRWVVDMQVADIRQRRTLCVSYVRQHGACRGCYERRSAQTVALQRRNSEMLL